MWWPCSGSSSAAIKTANCSITLEPPVAGAQIQLAQVGDWFEFGSTVSFEANGNQPFLLVQYMSGCYNVIAGTGNSSNCDQGATGDPYMLQAVPVEQWLTQLPFLTDTSYPRDFVTIIREQGTEVSLAWATSYGYPGGLSLNALWDPPIDPQG